MNTPRQTNSPAERELSVIVVVLNGGASLRRCLDVLRPQLPAAQMEIIVPHDDTLADADAFRRQYADVLFLHEPGRRTFAQLRAAGVRAAGGRIVAITEDQCIPQPPWCRNVLAAHQAPHAAIGGPIEKHEPDTALGWAIYLREFTGYIPPVEEGASASLTDCNVSYKREALEAIRDVWAEAFHEPNVHAALRARGALWIAPALVTQQQRTMPLGVALRERYDFGRLYASLRAREVPGWKRWLLFALSPLLPLLLTSRVASVVLRKRRYVGAFVRAFPYVALFAATWGWGEMVGYFTATPPEVTVKHGAGGSG